MNAADKAQLIEYAKMAKNKGLSRIYIHWTAGVVSFLCGSVTVCR